MTGADYVATQMSKLPDVSAVSTMSDDLVARGCQRSRTLPSILNEEEAPFWIATAKPSAKLQRSDGDYDSLAEYRSFCRRYSIPFAPAELIRSSPPSPPTPKAPSPLRENLLQSDEEKGHATCQSNTKLKFMRYNFRDEIARNSRDRSSESLTSQVAECPESPRSEFHEPICGQVDSDLKWGDQPMLEDKLKKIFSTVLGFLRGYGPQWAECVHSAEQQLQDFYLTKGHLKEEEMGRFMAMGRLARLNWYEQWLGVDQSALLTMTEGIQDPHPALFRQVSLDDPPFEFIEYAREKPAYDDQCCGTEPVFHSPQHGYPPQYETFHASPFAIEMFQDIGHRAEQDPFSGKPCIRTTKVLTKLQKLRKNTKDVDYFASDFVDYPSCDSDLLSFLKVPGAGLDRPQTFFKSGQRAELRNLCFITILENWVQTEIDEISHSKKNVPEIYDSYGNAVAGCRVILGGSVAMNECKFQGDKLEGLHRRGNNEGTSGARLNKLLKKNDPIREADKAEISDLVNLSLLTSGSATGHLVIRQSHSPPKGPLLDTKNFNRDRLFDRSQSMNDFKLPPTYTPMLPKRKPVGSTKENDSPVKDPTCVKDSSVRMIDIVLGKGFDDSFSLNELELPHPDTFSSEVNDLEPLVEVRITENAKSIKSDPKVRFRESVKCSASVDDSNCSSKGLRTSSTYSQETACEDGFGTPLEISQVGRSLGARLGAKVRRAMGKIGSLRRMSLHRGEVTDELFVGDKEYKFVD